MLSGPLLLVLLAAAILLLLVAIIFLRINAFLALLGVSLLTGLVAGLPMTDVAPVMTSGFGNTLGGVGIVIGLGIILGKILAEAGATEQLAHSLLKKTGNERAPLAINLTGYLASIPVFFDAGFVIFMPLLRSLSNRTGRSLITYIIALGVGLMATHAMVIPTPGPLTVAANLKVDTGMFILQAVLVSLPTALVGGWLYGAWLGRQPGYLEPAEEVHIPEADPTNQPDQLPGIGRSVGLLLFPLLLILMGSVTAFLLPDGHGLAEVLGFFGDKNVALLLGILLAGYALRGYFKRSVGELSVEAAADAGLILLITGAGGAFGAVLGATGIGDYLISSLTGWNFSLIWMGFLLSAIMRVALGSTTVALVTASSILGPLISAGDPGISIGLAICAGGMIASLPNDSGFWVVSRFGGLSVSQTLVAWTLSTTIGSLVAFGMVLLLSWLGMG
jgi:gluconate:H+ symporter, GntP family